MCSAVGDRRADYNTSTLLPSITLALLNCRMLTTSALISVVNLREFLFVYVWRAVQTVVCRSFCNRCRPRVNQYLNFLETRKLFNT